MNSVTLYRYYKGFIEEADDRMLASIKDDVVIAKRNQLLEKLHYEKLIRLIAKRKKENKVLEIA